MTRPVCPFHPDGQPMLARSPTTTTGKYFCMRCVPPRELGVEENVPPPEWESFSVTSEERPLMAEFIGQPRIELLGMEGEYHLIAVTFPITHANSSSKLDVVPNGCYGLVLRIRPTDLPRYLGGAQLIHKTITPHDDSGTWRWCPTCDGPLLGRGGGLNCLTCHSDVQVISVEEAIHRLITKIDQLEGQKGGG